MDWQQLRRMRRRLRSTFRVSQWPWRRKVAIGAWLPVAILAFVLFTGPNHSSTATAEVPEKPVTVTTVAVSPKAASVKDITQKLNEFKQTQNDVGNWIQATPNRLTLKQQVAKQRWRSDRRRQLLAKHKAAVASSHHRTTSTAK
jgi:hypothetical protein